MKDALLAIVGLLYLGGLLYGWVKFLKGRHPHADLLCCLLNIISHEGSNPHGRLVQVDEGFHSTGQVESPLEQGGKGM